MAAKTQTNCLVQCLWLFSVFLGAFCAVYNIEYETVADCQTGEAAETHEFFDISQLACRPCAQSAVFQTVDSSGLRCICQPGYRIVRYFGGTNLECAPCPTGTVTSHSGYQCVECANGLDSTGSECIKCQTSNIDGTARSRNIEVERLLNGSWSTQEATRTCQTCDENTGPDGSGRQCVRCNEILSVLPGQSDCICPEENAVPGGLCFREPTDIVEVNQQLFRVTFGGDSFESAYFADNIQAAAAMCQTPYSNLTACELLGNMCALLAYTRQFEGVTGSEDACALYLLYAQDNDWPQNMPWLYYLENGDEVLRDDGLTTVYTFPDSDLNIRVAQYALNGSFYGYRDVTNGLLQLCPNSENVLNAAYDFGTFYEQKCSISVRRFWDEEEYPLFFYDPYIEFEDGSENKLYAVPVLVQDYTDNSGGQPNVGDDSRQWQFVRRLFLVDNISGKRYVTETDPEDPEAPTTTVRQPVRYAKDITIYVELRTDGADGLIKPPYINVNYEVASAADYDADTTTEVSFKITYRMKQTQPENRVEIAIGVLAAFAGIYGGIQTWGWSRRSGKLGIDFVVFVKFLVFCMGNLANIFFVVMLGYSLWWVIFYKRQNTVSAIVPDSDQEGYFVAFVASAFALKLLQLIHLIIVQCTVDIFFIDWERPRGKVVTSSDKQGGKEAPVSIWRTYFAANEWNEIQTTRKINNILQLFATVFFLEVIGFGNLATKDPYSRYSRTQDTYYSPESRIFRFGIMGLTYLIIAIIQWIFFRFFYERFVEHKIRQYVDLCSMCNISVFILETGQFGYYIHGQSVHGRADTGMREMAENLKREEESLCGQRGLLPQTDQQTFQIAVTASMRHQYDRVVGPIYNEQATSRGAQQGAGQGPGGPSLDPHTDKCLQAYGVLNRFLQAFIDHSVRDIDYVVKDKTFMENIMNMEFTDPLTQGFFYNDNGTSFDSVLFYGHENTLVIFEILTFAVVDLGIQNFTLAAIITYLLMQIFSAIRDGIGRSNLAKKTLVDKRFLI